MENIYQPKKNTNRFFPYIIPIAFPFFFPLGFGLAVALGYINVPIMLILSSICTLLLIKEQSLIEDNDQNRMRFFPHIIPIAFPLLFPLGFGVSVALVHVLPPVLVPVFAALLVVMLVFVLGLQSVVIIWTLALWICSTFNSIVKMYNQLMQRHSPQPRQPHDQPLSQEQAYYPPQEQVQ